jgi:uncharacterized OsmC-like protein
MGSTQSQTSTLNGVCIKALQTTIEGVKATPAMAKFSFRVHNEWQDGARNRSTINAFSTGGQQMSRVKPFTLSSDEPKVLLGEDTAVNPVEYLLHSLAACVTTSMVYHAAARGIQIEEVESSFEGDVDLHGFLDLDPGVRKGVQGIRVRLRIKADVPESQLSKIAELGTGHSPVFDSLTRGLPISVEAEAL